jgi:hypothetical protein
MVLFCFIILLGPNSLFLLFQTSRRGSHYCWITVSVTHENHWAQMGYLKAFVATDRKQLSKMISTIDFRNGFREDLLPLALSTYSSASEGLRNAILSVAAYHLWGSEVALPFKAKALRSLSSSLAAESVGGSETQLATSMMLCVYNVGPTRV